MTSEAQMMNAMAQVNNALQPLASPGRRCFLLKREGQTKRYAVVGSELTSGFRMEFDDNRTESGLLRYASSDTSFADDWFQSTHVGYGVPNDDGEVDVYEFVEEEKDSIPPSMFSPFWSGRVNRLRNERFTIT
jgi:hypothetical protein